MRIPPPHPTPKSKTSQRPRQHPSHSRGAHRSVPTHCRPTTHAPIHRSASSLILRELSRVFSPLLDRFLSPTVTVLDNVSRMGSPDVDANALRTPLLHGLSLAASTHPSHSPHAPLEKPFASGHFLSFHLPGPRPRSIQFSGWLGCQEWLKNLAPSHALDGGHCFQPPAVRTGLTWSFHPEDPQRPSWCLDLLPNSLLLFHTLWRFPDSVLSPFSSIPQMPPFQVSLPHTKLSFEFQTPFTTVPDFPNSFCTQIHRPTPPQTPPFLWPLLRCLPLPLSDEPLLLQTCPSESRLWFPPNSRLNSILMRHRRPHTPAPTS